MLRRIPQRDETLTLRISAAMKQRLEALTKRAASQGLEFLIEDKHESWLDEAITRGGKMVSAGGPREPTRRGLREQCDVGRRVAQRG